MKITNSNGPRKPLYRCSSTDGFLVNVLLLAQGASKAGYIVSIRANVDDMVEIKFTSPTDILLTKL